jgi:hypothetical protein
VYSAQNFYQQIGLSKEHDEVRAYHKKTATVTYVYYKLKTTAETWDYKTISIKISIWSGFAEK